MTADPTPPVPMPSPTPAATPRRRLLRDVLWTVALAAALAGGGYRLLVSQFAVDLAMDQLRLRSGGHLEIDGATGSLLEAIDVKRLAWRSDDTTMVATDVSLRWSPTALWSRGIVISALGATRIELEVKPSTAASSLPDSLALPFEIAIEKLAIGRLDWQVGPRKGTIDGLGLAYAGGAAGHRFTGLSLAAKPGTLRGSAGIGSRAPFPIEGRLDLKGDAAGQDAAADVTLSGSLAALAVDAAGTAGTAKFTAHVALAPFAAVPLVEIAVDAAAVDIAAWDPSLPETRLDLLVRARPAGGGLAGTVTASNARPGPVDAGRVPLAALAAQFGWQADALTLDGLDASLPGRGRITGKARIPQGEGATAGTWSLDVRDVDLRAIHGTLISTRVSGRIHADLDAARQRITGDLADRGIVGGLSLSFAALLDDRRLDVERFRARAGTSELEGRGSVGRLGEHAFTVDATARQFDPSRVGSYPAGKLDGHVVASGVLVPAWRATVDATLAAGSRLAGVALSGTATGTVTRNGVKNAHVAVAAASAKLTAEGSAGDANDTLRATIDAPRVQELLPLLPALVPSGIAGALQATAAVTGPLATGAVAIDGKGTALKMGSSFAAGAVDLRFRLAPAATTVPVKPTAGADFMTRVFELTVAAKDVVAPPGSFATADGSLKGTLAAHTAGIAFTSNDVTVAAAAHGGLSAAREADPAAGYAWSGTVDALEARGPVALRLTAPAAVSIARNHVAVGAARIVIADGEMRIADLAWDDGRITTHGSFTAVPLATAADIAGVALPFASTLTLGGDWSLAAAPRLNGTIVVRRESGDLRLVRDGVSDAPGLALGITALELAARFADDGIDATAAVQSTNAGTAGARLTVATVPGAEPGRIPATAPLALTAHATLPTLRPLQPWLGTVALIDGRAVADVAARGTLAAATLSGTLRAEALRLDAPQYGVHFSDGRLAAHFAEGSLVLDELALTAGAGKLLASGTASARTARDTGPAASIKWHADNFRVFNRPELHLVVDGDGTAALDNGRLVLAGSLKADEGRFVYVSATGATLGDDVVVKGWAKPAPSALQSSDLPLSIDLALDLGDRLTFSGEGLETALQGTLRITSGLRGLNAKGSIRAVNGTYFAFGRRLTIDPGRLIFNGPIDNPGLDIIALRKGLAVEAGVTVTGTARLPIIALTSNPPVSDGEKLSWLVLGQGLDRTSGTDIAALQAASALLMGRNSKPVTTQIAESVGLDDISIRGSSASTRAGTRTGATAESQVVAFSKRISDRLSLVYEQGLSIANNAIKIEYALTQRLSLQAEMGIISGIGIRYNVTLE